MVDLRYDGAVGALFEGMGAGLGQLEVVQTDAGPVVVSVSGRDGGVICVGFDGQGRPQIVDQRFFETDIQGAADGRLSVVQVGSDTVVVVGANGNDQLLGYRMGADGMDARVSLSGAAVAGPRGAQMAQTDNGFIFSAAADGSLRCFRGDDTRRALSAGEVIWDTDTTFHGLPTALETLSVGGRSYLLSTSAEEPGVSVFAVDDATGRLEATSSMGTALGLGLYETPTDLATAQIGGRSYVIVSSRGETTAGAALSVLELTDDGRLVATDHILDNLTTRFGSVSGISVVEHNGWTYVVAGGADQGVDIFTLMPAGKLVHLDTVTTELGASLDSLTDVVATVVGNRLNLLATSHQRAEITGLSADLSDQGQIQQTGEAGGTLTGGARDDMLIGGGGIDLLRGGAGDDILYDGAGADRLVGGQGADLFVMAFDGARDTIEDFNVDEDRLDLSLTPMLYSMAQITVTSYSWGARLSFRGQELDLRSAGGGRLQAADVTQAIDWTIDRPPMLLQEVTRGSAAADTLEGGEGSDVIFGDGGADVIYGGAGSDRIDAGQREDTVYAGAGSDTVLGGQGRDLLFLGDGADVFIDDGSGGAQQRDTVYGGFGDDTLTSLTGGDELHGGAGNDRLVGGRDADRIYGGTGFDTVHAGDGDDSVWGGDGRDEVHLDAGDDRFFDNGQGGALGRDRVYAGTGNDTIEGGNGDDVFFGEDGNDLIYARLGNDTVYGGSQSDTVHAGDGNDVVFGGNGQDVIYLNRGDDLFVDNGQGGPEGRDRVFGGYGNDTIEGGNGDDVFFGEWGDDIIHARLGNDSVYAGDGNDRVWGGDGRDLAFLGQGDDIFFDTGEGGDAGRDTVYAGAGNDTIEGGNGDDVFFGEWGDDIIHARLGNDSVYAGDGNDRVWGGDGRDLAFLGQGDDIFFDTGEGGDAGRDTVYAGAGNDTIEGGNGDDVFFGEAGNDVIFARMGHDSVYGGGGFDVIDTGAGNDLVYAGEGRDRVFLGAGDDRYVDTAQGGVLGQDTITGGQGADTFVFGPQMGRDVITDFERDVDLLMIDRSLAGNLGTWGLVREMAQVTDAGVLINFGDGQSLLLEDLTSTDGLFRDIDLFS